MAQALVESDVTRHISVSHYERSPSATFDAGAPDPAVSTYTYDSNGRLHQITQPDGTTIQYSYDAHGAHQHARDAGHW